MLASSVVPLIWAQGASCLCHPPHCHLPRGFVPVAGHEVTAVITQSDASLFGDSFGSCSPRLARGPCWVALCRHPSAPHLCPAPACSPRASTLSPYAGPWLRRRLFLVLRLYFFYCFFFSSRLPTWFSPFSSPEMVTAICFPGAAQPLSVGAAEMSEWCRGMCQRGWLRLPSRAGTAAPSHNGFPFSLLKFALDGLSPHFCCFPSTPGRQECSAWVLLWDWECS